MGSAGIICVLPFVFMISAASAFSSATDVSSMTNGISPFWPQHALPVKRNANAKNVQLCGMRLVETVRAFCNGRLFTGYARRSDPTMIDTFNEDSLDLHEPNSNAIEMGQDAQYNTMDSYWDKDNENSLSDFELNWPHSPKSLAFKVLTEGKAHQRVRRSISDECCLKACSQNDMAKYCSATRGGSRGRRMAVY